ncbi:MAG: DegV family EDD domain-containing protein, partial [Pseudomonadota bacterium]|nr:DegV family EDD domain-containing protein [Pseudomonadota bacterium]
SPVLPRTSQPPPGDFRRQFDFLLSHHPSVVYLGVARALSGTIQAAEAAARRGDPDRTFIFDSANTAGGQALLVMAAAEAARRGDDAPSILAQLEALRPRTVLWAITRDLTMVVRGGRLPAWSKALVDALGMTPVARMKPDGRLRITGGMFGRHRVPERFAAYVARRIDQRSRWRVIVGHCDAAADGEVVLRSVRGLIDCHEAWIVETGPAIGAHAGPGALLICLQPVD